MAVKDAFCNGENGRPAGLADLDISHSCEEISPGWWKCKFHEDSCEEEKWVGAPDKEDDLGGRWGAGLIYSIHWLQLSSYSRLLRLSCLLNPV